MRVIRVALFVAFILALTPAPAAAADIRAGQDITIGANETIEDDLYIFGNAISILGTVRGDVVAVGQNISVDGNVTGDLIAAGNTVAIRGQVGESARVAAQSVVIDGRVGGDVVSAGNDLTIMGNGRIGRDLIVGSNSATISGQVGRDVQAGANSLKIDGRVGRDVLATVNQLQLTDRAAVDGSLTYTSSNEAQIANPASVKGRTERRTPQSNQQPPLVQGPAATVLDWLRGLIGLLILGAVVVFFFPGFSRRAGEALVRSPWLSLAIGSLVLIGLPILAFVMFFLGILIGGWWIGFVALAAYVVVLALAVPVAAVGVGGSLLRVTRRPAPVWLALILGLIVLLLVALVPILGGIVIFLAILFGLGATTMAIVGGRRPEPVPA
ncbi:MAG TPA: polymer-forming cytoskeletal protein [Candidatus Limnocylindria bacterium]|jgi:cytoskeletal protein CcmA (bactofilin family)|nr:polymer-forming cytoskeletal protein [Candidatus Limnocylindria bacterium]